MDAGNDVGPPVPPWPFADQLSDPVPAGHAPTRPAPMPAHRGPFAPPPASAPDPWADAPPESIPYLGTDPAPSRAIGRLLIAMAVLGIVVRLIHAFVLVQLAGVDQRLVDHHERVVLATRFGGTVAADPILVADYHAVKDHLTVVQIPVLLTWVATIGLALAWNVRRRRPAELARFGETHVETSVSRLRPAAIPKSVFGLAAAAFAVGVMGRTSATTQLADLPMHRWETAAGTVLWAITYLLVALTVVASERLLARRLLVSNEVRSGAAPAPFVAPIAPVDPTADLTDARIGWVLATAGKVMVILVGPVLTIGFIGEAFDPAISARPQFAIAGVLIGALTAWVLIRRWLPDRWALRRPKQPPALSAPTSF